MEVDKKKVVATSPVFLLTRDLPWTTLPLTVCVSLWERERGCEKEKKVREWKGHRGEREALEWKGKKEKIYIERQIKREFKRENKKDKVFKEREERKTHTHRERERERGRERERFLKERDRKKKER